MKTAYDIIIKPVITEQSMEESEAKNAKIAEEKGCTLTTLTDEELKAFQDAVAPMYDSFLDADQKAIVERVQALG